MSIQANINQMLSLAGILASQSPQLTAMAKKREELSELSKKEKVLQKQYEIVSGSTAPKEGESDKRPVADEFGTEVFTGIPDVNRAEKIEGELANIAQERFVFSPSDETYAAALQSDQEPGPNVPKEASERVSAFKRHLEAEKKAQEAVKVKQEETRKTRRNFLDYMKDEPTSLGGTFKELDPALQKKIISQYSKAERKKIMDRKDTANG